ncbi:MAG: TA system VapC family ribonuclease toxin [Burkholderiales bacterium]
MTTYLLDPNVLIALIDPAHVHHETAHGWFKARGRRGWASCPLTENGVIRIVSHPKLPNHIGSPGLATDVVSRLCRLPGHVFWPDDISVLDDKYIDATRLLSSSQITDSYLLALACAHNGQLATFDNRLVVDAVRNGRAGLHLIR